MKRRIRLGLIVKVDDVPISDSIIIRARLIR